MPINIRSVMSVHKNVVYYIDKIGSIWLLRNEETQVAYRLCRIIYKQ